MEAILSARHECAYLLENSEVVAFATTEGMEPHIASLENVANWLRTVEEPVFLSGVSGEQVVERLCADVAVEHALRLLLIFSDDDLSDDTRELAALDIEDLLVERCELHAQLAATFYAKPMPASVDLRDWIARARKSEAVLLVSFAERLLANQPSIHEVALAWATIPDALFENPDARSSARELLSRAGFARDLVWVAVEGHGADEFLVEHLGRPELTEIRNYRAIIQAWVAPFREHHPLRQTDLVPEERGTDEGGQSPVSHRHIQNIPRVVSVEKLEQLKGRVRRDIESGRFAELQKHTDWLVTFQLDHGPERFAGMSLCDLATEAKRRGKSAEQIYLAERAKTVSPEDPQCWCQWADALHTAGRCADALAAYDETLSEHRESVVAKNGRAEVLKELNRLDEALAAYDETVRQHRDDVFAKNGRAEVLRELNRLDEALAAYDETLCDNRDSVVAKCGRAEVLRELNRLDDALAAYDETLSEHQDSVVPKNGRAEVLKELNRLDEALAAYDETVRDHRDDVVTKNGRAEVLRELNRFDEALAAYDETVRDHRDNVVAKCGRAEVLRELNRLDEALAAYDETVREHRDDVVAKCGRAEVLRELNRLDDALAAYEHTMVAHPQNRVGRNGCAKVLLKLGRFDEALALVAADHPVSHRDWVDQHLRGMILLRSGDVGGARAIFSVAATVQLPARHRAYYRSALALCDLRDHRPWAALTTLESVTDTKLQNAVNVIRAHAFGGNGQKNDCATTLRILAPVKIREVREAADEIDARFLKGIPRYEEAWLIDCEAWLLLRAA